MLKRLTEVGDPVADTAFKNEIAKRFLSGYPPVIIFLIREKYLEYLDDEQYSTLLHGLDELLNNNNSKLIDVRLRDALVYIVQKYREKGNNRWRLASRLATKISNLLTSSD